MKYSILYIFILLLLIAITFTCNNAGNLYNPTDEEGVTISAFAADTTGVHITVSKDSIEDALETEITIYVCHTVTFLGFIKGDSNLVKWEWDFGDGDTSVQRIIEHTYIEKGDFKAVFSITDVSDFILSDTILITVEEISGAAIRGYVFYEGKSAHDSIEIVFESELSVLNPIYTNINGLYEVESDFPSGTYTVTFTPVKKPDYPADTLKEIVVENGELTVIDSVILEDSYLPYIANNSPKDTISIRQPVITANFIDTCSGIAPETFVLIFNGDTIADSLITIASSNFSWTLDYRLPDGKHSVVTSIKDSADNSDKLKWNFTVDAMKLTAMDDTTVGINDTTYLHGAVSNVYSKVEEYKWDFDGNGTWDDSITTSDTEISQPHVYNHESTYYAVLYARDDSGMVKYDIVKITVDNSSPVIGFIREDTTISIKDSISLTASAVDNDGIIAEYAWNFNGDGSFDYTSALEINTGYRYDTAGTYNSILRVTDDDNKQSFDTAVITVLQDAPVINFASDDTIVAYGGKVKCSVSVQQQFGTITVEVDTANEGNWVIVTDNEVSAVKNIAVGTASSWDSVKVRVTDDDGNVVYTVFKVDIRPRPLTINSMDSTVNTITVNYSQTLESDFSEYRIYRNTTSDVDSADDLCATVTISETITYQSTDEGYDFTRYYYLIYQVDIEGLYSVGSNVFNARIKNSPPETPEIVFPANNNESMWSDDTLKWSSCSDSNNHTVKYRVLINHNSTVYTEFANELTDTSIKLTGYDSLSMVWKVIAYDSEADSSNWSNERTTPIIWAGPKGMKLIPSGLFVDDVDTGWSGDTAYITYDFWMDSTEVTQRQYLNIMGTNPSNFIGDNKPVESVTWYDAIMYCNLLSKSRGLDTVYTYDAISSSSATNLVCNWNTVGYRLPTEDEWELAARAGQQLEYPTDDGTISSSKANYDNNNSSTVDAASYPANPYGLYDLAGNVCEWCWDWYGSSGRVSGRSDYRGESSGSDRVKRGGDWINPGTVSLPSAYRFFNFPISAINSLGFRIVLPAP